MILVDTDTWIDFFQGIDPGARAVEALLITGRAAWSVISVFELFCGAVRPSQVRDLESLLARIEPLVLTQTAARRAACEYERLKGLGQLIGNQDLFIAAIALELDIPVLTRNHDHFRRIHGLTALRPEEIVES